MARVVVVHGIGQEFSGPESMAQLVVPALRDGVALAAVGARLSPEDVSCAFYGDVFRPEGTRSVDVPPWDETDVDADFEAELLAAWWAEAARIDPAVFPDEEGTRGLLSSGASKLLLVDGVRQALDALSACRYFAKVAEPLLIFSLKQVKAYFRDERVRRAAVARLAARIGEDTRVVVAHSLGSVVAYEALCANPDWPVTTLVTLGSPLGMRGLVFDRLDPLPADRIGAWPGGIDRWTNIADDTDIVALVRELRPRFAGPVHDVPVRNGAGMHDLTRYLTARQTGEAVAAGLTTTASGPGHGPGITA